MLNSLYYIHRELYHYKPSNGFLSTQKFLWQKHKATLNIINYYMGNNILCNISVLLPIYKRHYAIPQYFNANYKDFYHYFA